MMDRDADQKEAMEAAGTVLPLIHRVLDASVAFYFDDTHYSPDARADHDERAMASCIYSHAVKKMIAECEAATGLIPLNVRGFRLFNNSNTSLIRLKKVRPNGKHSNYQTRQQQDYDDQADIPGLPMPAFRLTAGYQLDAAGSALERVMIARPIGRTIFWTAQVTMVDSVAQWEDITPARFNGTHGIDFEMGKVRGRRGRK